MQLPITVSYRNVEKTEGTQNLLEGQAAKLERVCGHMTSCRVAIERMNAHQQTGSPYRMRLEVHVPPGHTLVVNHEPGEGDLHDELPTIIRQTFSAMRRQLDRLVRKQQGEVKTHPVEEDVAMVVRLHPEEGYGFLQTVEGREIYFHRNAVASDAFERLEIGTGVRFVEQEGEKGPQASTVFIVERPGSRVPPPGRGEAPDISAGWGQ